ncbi:MAG: cobalt-zinc-cadmium resistance protein CzcC [Stygiobacter sp.]|nr:MAG: cobalt-zinc-cadmium resistance protein CzcC [Stygiobacter sp.]KAF0217987.1 MAG: cobalt-zinc-cadmium resistance protein [Ignavibacteria bacterium]
MYKQVITLLLFCSLTFYGQTKKLTLNEAIETAVKNNPQILTIEKELLAAEGKILQAGRIPNAEFSIESNEIPTNFSIGNSGELDFNFSQTLELFGKRSTRIQGAEFESQITQINVERIKKIITAQVKTAYYQSLLSRETIKSIEQNITLLNDFLVQVKDKYQAGTSSYLDVIRAKVESARLKNELFDVNKQFQQNIGNLKIFLGVENGVGYELVDSLNYNFLTVPLDSIHASLIGQSNFIKMNGLRIEREKSFLTLAEKSSLPDINFGASFQNRQPIPGKGFDKFFGLKLGITLPMFYSSGVRGDIQESSALLDISNIQHEAIRKIITQKIISSYKSLGYAEEQLRVFDKSLLLDIEDELRAGINAYQNNQIDVLNLFDIYRTYRSTKLEYSRAIFNCLTARNDLEISNESASE